MTLVLGDGNFTFSLSSSKHPSLCDSDGADGRPRLVATSLETREQVLCRSLSQATLAALRVCPQVRLLHGVDATKLESCQPLKELGLVFDVVVFNFPHSGGKGKIQLNRSLLQDFFASVTASGLLSRGGEVHVTLCAGQGGTPRDSIDRGHQNSWKVTEMAAEGGFVLCGTEPFSLAEHPGYIPTGYRGHTDKGFRVEGALRHVFKFPSPSQPSLYPPHYLHDVSFWWHDGERIDEEVLKAIALRVGGDYVQDIACVDCYHPDKSASKVGYCYRVGYWSLWDALSRKHAGRLQLLLRQTLAEEMGVELR